MSLSSNLTLLEPLDPALWRNIQGFRMNRHGPDRELCDSEVCDHVQCECQRAIGKRGWHWLLEDADPSLKTISGKFLCDICDSKYTTLADYIEGETPADAILAAYVKCLQELA
jgi:hypothetical protein